MPDLTTGHTEILSFIGETYDLVDPLDETTELVRSQVIDSYGIVEMIDFLEHTFSIRFPDEEITPENFYTVAAIADCVTRIRSAT